MVGLVAVCLHYEHLSFFFHVQLQFLVVQVVYVQSYELYELSLDLVLVDLICWILPQACMVVINLSKFLVVYEIVISSIKQRYIRVGVKSLFNENCIIH